MGAAKRSASGGSKRKRWPQLLAAGTDGQDGPTPVAGVLVEEACFLDSELREAASEALSRHDSYGFWKRCKPEWLLDTNGPTGVNVMDVYCILRDSDSSLSSAQ